MKYFFSFTILLFSTIFSFAQKNSYTSGELKRIGDLGRIWGMVNYFHPAMGNGTINTQELITYPAEVLANDPSAENFKTVVNKMLGPLGDPYTNMLPSVKPTNTVLNKSLANAAEVHRLSNGYWYVALPTTAASSSEVTKIPGILPEQWDSARGIILDLRNLSYGESDDYDFMVHAMPLILQKLAGNTALPEISERIIYHNGMVPQEDGENNVYYSGWQTLTAKTTSSRQRTPMPGGSLTYDKPVLVVVNTNSTYNLMKKLMALRAANKIMLFYEGEQGGWASGHVTDIPVADGQTFHLRTSDLIVGANGSAPRPDGTIPAITDFDEKGTYLQQCFALLDKGLPSTAGNAQTLSQQYQLPRFSDTHTGFMPTTGERLLAIYNYWNAIRYFNPYKKLLPKDWEGIMEEHLPSFLLAKDSVQYNYALRSLISELHDCHGFFSSPKGTTPVRYELGNWPAVEVSFVGEKLFVTSVAKDSASVAGKNIRLWDEMTAIDGMSIPKWLEKMRWYLSTSNEATYRRDIAGILLGGKLNSKVAVTLNRNGSVVKETLVRSGRYFAKENLLDFNGKYPAVKMLDNNVGYVNMGALQQSEVDSMFIKLANTKAIIFDSRNYPKGTAWSIAPRLTGTKKQAVKFHYPFITAENILGGENDFIAESFFTVIPDTSKPTYKGKVVMLCNATTQSQAEYSIMMFQGATDVTVIGSQTAGADGNVTNIILPGNYRTSFSGLEILYPDGGQTQRSGVRINIQSGPTVKGLKEGRDEVMERALQFVSPIRN